jgi:hypothetical protein
MKIFHGFCDIIILPMTIRHDRHAKRRMKERDVLENEVETVIQSPDYTEPSVKGRINAFKFLSGPYLRVTYKNEGDGILVITVTIRKKPFERLSYEN